jgi:hypothetical protein
MSEFCAQRIVKSFMTPLRADNYAAGLANTQARKWGLVRFQQNAQFDSKAIEVLGLGSEWQLVNATVN